jgi:hypothetical protein
MAIAGNPHFELVEGGSLRLSDFRMIFFVNCQQSSAACIHLFLKASEWKPFGLALSC